MEETSVRVAEKCQMSTIQYVDMAAFCVWPGQVVDPALSALGNPGKTLSQRKYLPSCLTKPFPTPANYLCKGIHLLHYTDCAAFLVFWRPFYLGLTTVPPPSVLAAVVFGTDNCAAS
jgi:hypothetical protein